MMPEAIAQLRAQRPPSRFDVWEENWEIVMMFARMATQWQVGTSGLVGLNYPSLEWLCKLYSVEEPVTIFEGIQVMEMTVLGHMRAKDK